MRSFEFTVNGHQNVLSTHKSTFEFTKEAHLSKKGDCIIGVRSSMGCLDLPEWFSSLSESTRVKIEIFADKHHFEGHGYTHPSLKLLDPHEMVFRKSEFISDRTVLINCSFSSRDIPQPIVQFMQNPENKMTVRLTVGETNDRT